MKARLVITLMSDICVGNGENLGNRIDTDIYTDQYGLPVIPARRIKGCLRAAMDMLCENRYVLPNSKAIVTKEMTDTLFGTSSRGAAFALSNAVLPDYRKIISAIQAVRSEKDSSLADEAMPEKITSLYTAVKGQTRLKDGVAADNSLRYTRILRQYIPLKPDQPLCFVSDVDIECDNPELFEALSCCCKATRHIGTGRNRGLGFISCRIDTVSAKEAKRFCFTNGKTTGSGIKRLEYKVCFDSGIVIRGENGVSSSVPARNVIGCMTEVYLKDHKADDLFDRLFQSSEVCWSALTPVIDGKISVPAPSVLAKNKLSGTYTNVYNAAEEDGSEKKKPLTGYYSISDGKKYVAALPDMNGVYHHRHAGKNRDAILYRLDSVSSESLYGGTVTFPAELEETIVSLLSTADFRVGHSRAAQYAACTVCDIKDTADEPHMVTVPVGETVFVILESDLLVSRKGIFTVENENIREHLAGKLGLDAAHPEEKDLCSYQTTGGFQACWGLWKPVYPVVKAGSVYCFVSNGSPLPERLVTGDRQQEGYGCCRVCSLHTMPAEVKLNEYTDKFDHGEQSGSFRSLLISAAAEEAALNTMTELFSRHPEWGRDTGLLGRLRQMVRDCDTPVQMKSKIDGITDDKKKTLASGIFSEVVGNGEREAVIRHLLNSREELCSAVMKDRAACDTVYENWKQPFMRLLHDFYYGKRDDNQ